MNVSSRPVRGESIPGDQKENGAWKSSNGKVYKRRISKKGGNVIYDNSKPMTSADTPPKSWLALQNPEVGKARAPWQLMGDLSAQIYGDAPSFDASAAARR